MIDLPRRSAILDVPVQGGQATLHVEPLTDAQYLRLQETGRLTGDGGLLFQFSANEGLFEDRLRGVTGVVIDGAPFDPKNSDHIARIPQPWKALALSRLLRYASGLPDLSEADRGNSKRPADPSSPAATPSTD